MNNCATCKYWQDYKKEPDTTLVSKWEILNYQELGLGKCLKVDHIDMCYGGRDDHGNLMLDEKHHHDLAFAADCDNYHAELLTKAEFGCVQHEAKDE